MPFERRGDKLVMRPGNYKLKPDWVGLTEEEIDNFIKAVWPREATPRDYILAIEAKLKEKNT